MVTINLFRNATDTESFSPGQVLFEEGDAGDLMYVVNEGEVDIVFRNTVLETVGPGGILGEMALIENKPRSATAVARSDVKVVPINQKRFAFLVQQTPLFSIQVMRVMADRLRRMTARL